MCVFGAIVANNYILAPYMQALFSFSVALAVPEPMWELPKLGVGGYILGRSGEKAIRAWREGGSSAAICILRGTQALLRVEGGSIAVYWSRISTQVRCMPGIPVIQSERLGRRGAP